MGVIEGDDVRKYGNVFKFSSSTVEGIPMKPPVSYMEAPEIPEISQIPDEAQSAIAGLRNLVVTLWKNSGS